MIINAETAQTMGVLNVANEMCIAARTAPKAKGTDHIQTAVLTGEDLEKLAAEMEKIAKDKGMKFFLRDAGNIRNSQAVVLIGTTEGRRGLKEACQLCHYENCKACEKADGVCVFDPMDLGIAIGSAVSKAADLRVDNRVLFSAGMAAKSLGILGKETTMIMAIPLSVSGKSIYFDRK